MTEKEIDAMEAGREMDAAVHMALYPRHNIETFENIDLLLWHHCDGEHEKGDSCRWKEIPRYSTDIGAAWQVVEKLRQDTRAFRLGYFEGVWWCYAGCPEPPDAYSDSGNGDTAPLAICRAALKAVDCHKI